MTLHDQLLDRASDGFVARVGVLGTGTTAELFLSQALDHSGFQIVGVAGAKAEKAAQVLADAGWPKDRITSYSASRAVSRGLVFVTSEAALLVEAGTLDIVVIAGGTPASAVRLARLAIKRGRHVIMAVPMADVLAGPLLAAEADQAGVVYSLAHGDSGAQIADLMDWARLSGFRIITAGKTVVPDETGIADDSLTAHGALDDMLDLASAANASGLTVPANGLTYPSSSLDELADLASSNQSKNPEVTAVKVQTVDAGIVFVVFEAQSEAARAKLANSGAIVGSTAGGGVAAMWRPAPLGGMELARTIANIALNKLASSRPTQFTADVAAVAATTLEENAVVTERQLGGRLMDARRAQDLGAVPIGLAIGAKMKRAIPAGEIVTWNDLVLEKGDELVSYRHRMEDLFLPPRLKPTEKTAKTKSPEPPTPITKAVAAGLPKAPPASATPQPAAARLSAGDD